MNELNPSNLAFVVEDACEVEYVRSIGKRTTRWLDALRAGRLIADRSPSSSRADRTGGDASATVSIDVSKGGGRLAATRRVGTGDVSMGIVEVSGGSPQIAPVSSDLKPGQSVSLDWPQDVDLPTWRRSGT